ncbi:putative MFS family arabinose efflux permease [Streptomyces canus]|uniref:MFS family arabinose efflux permease n=1 Tax=Streptomyces canus TaxID=58343 RepID=A0AAW8FI33_9ACTN|nr:MFS transporter [Streptomyces canus]MDQ0908692.1 putative MFS family arabinose efflux permease [Streptomyces canus]
MAPGVSSTAPPALSRPLILLLSVACGIAVANIYFPQAISPLIAEDLHVRPASAALVVTCAQLGYAAGIFLLVPLGDRLRHRGLITTLLLVTCAGLVLAGTATSLPVLAVASALVGLTTVVPQILIPMAAGLTAPERRGAVTGTLLSGLIGGILLARTFSGTLGEWLGWRAPYLVAAVMALILTLALAAALPHTTPSTDQRYPALLAASLHLLRTEPLLRRSCQYQVLVFAAFSAAWTALALFITGPHYNLGTPAVGVLALVGAVSMFATPIAGRRTDRRGPDAVNLVCMLGAIAAGALLLTGRLGGAIGLVGLGAGMLLLDVAMQSGQVANQARIFALRPEARARLNTAYMTCAFLGGSAGSWLGVRAYSAFGWNGVCGLVALLAGLALLRHVLRSREVTAAADARMPAPAGENGVPAGR